ncbi:hypothetical protein [Mammaliicoccus sciuri]|uniref:hypothetical protein n=1 Tax=Mammaliicoccus sciuri TaxID=1296 RepID=UPI002DBEDD15|nr:hypothetical protein [Mammaliicoccus sciuri]MEB7049135.1 hypothetical protein [Mammaliicoccus sciuri]
MKVFINCIRKSSPLKDKIIQELPHSNIEWIDLYDETLEDDVFAITVNTIEAVKNNEDAKAIIKALKNQTYFILKCQFGFLISLLF